MIYALWFLIGVAVGCGSVVFQFSTLRNLKPGANSRIIFTYLGGMLARLLVIGIMFYFAIRSGLLQTGLCFLGLIFSRWISLIIANKRQKPVVKEI